MKLVRFLAGITCLTIATPAAAEQITYTAKGFASAVVVGVGVFDGAFTAVGVGDTSNYFNPVGFPTVNAVVLDSLTLTIDGNSAVGLEPTVFFTNPPANFAGFNSVHAGAPGNLLGVLGFNFAAPNNYDALGDFASAAVAFSGSQTAFGPLAYMTNAGPVYFQRVNIQSFEAALSKGGAVPEPASWAMMITAFGFAGNSLRRRTRVNVSFA